LSYATETTYMQNLFLRFVLGLCCLVVTVTAAHAQVDTTDTFDFDDIPVDDVRPPYLGVGGGYLGMLTFMNFDDLNTIGRSFGLDDFSGQVFMNGGGGLTAIGLVPNLRVGVFGAGGSLDRTVNVSLGGTAYTRTLRFGLGITAAQFDYAIPIFDGFTVFPGVMLGGGTATLELTQTRAENPTFQDLVDNATYSDSGVVNFNRSTNLSRSRFYVNPAVNFEYVPIQFLMIRAGVGYGMLTNWFGGEWKDPAGATVSDVPDINANGLAVQFGLFIGLFQR